MNKQELRTLVDLSLKFASIDGQPEWLKEHCSAVAHEAGNVISALFE